MLLLLQALSLLLSPSTFASDAVTVHWEVHFTPAVDSTAAPIQTSPTPAYLNILHGCGFTANIDNPFDEVPVSVLRCQGVLDFSAAAKIRARVDARLAKAAAATKGTTLGNSIPGIRAKLAKVDFGISPFGVFFSALDGAGTERVGAINVAEAKLVILNKVYWGELAGSADADSLLLHESLEALGLDDTNYTLSIELFFLSQGATPKDFDSFLPKLAMLEGGASVVGRGGDSNQLFFKASLMLLVDKKLEVAGVAPALLPSPATLRELIATTPITEAQAAFFTDQSLCLDLTGANPSAFYCGGFTLNGVGGKPFLLITQEWGDFSNADRSKLLLKIFQDMVSNLIEAKQK